MRVVLGTVLAAVAMFFWGFLYWGINQLPYQALEMPEDAAGAQAVIDQHFAKSGTWFVPGMNPEAGTQEELEKLHQQGPNAIIHVRTGESDMGQVMFQGFLGMLATAFCLAVLLNKVKAQFPGYADRVRYAGAIGVVGAVLIDVGDAVWWFNGWGWQMYNLFYHISACLVAGLVLAAIIKPDGNGK